MPRDETLENPFLIQSKPLKQNVEIIKKFGKSNDPNAVDRMGSFRWHDQNTRFNEDEKNERNVRDGREGGAYVTYQ